ncbi:hypothetical protein ACHQM5_014840 [Ranunculus cassubicifolius]
MASLRRSGIVFFMVMATLLRVSMGVVYMVGDTNGWTTVGNFNYKKWAAAKTFHVGDTIVFQYNPQFHNVMQVSYEDYKACRVPATPITTYKDGNDSITIKNYGHYFYICGQPGHCQAGQKVDIRVPRTSSMQGTAPSSAAFPSNLPSPSPSPSPSEDMETLAPTGNNASPLSMSILWLGIIAGLAYFGV